MNKTTISLVFAKTSDDINQVRLLFVEYEKAIGVDLCFQGFEKELAELPGQYAPPDGCIILAKVDLQIAGCVALRRFDKDICEMKRLYIRPPFRALGIGRNLAVKAIEEATKCGYPIMRLDTLPSMTEAISLYRSLGFIQIDSYRYNPHDGAIYMEKQL